MKTNIFNLEDGKYLDGEICAFSGSIKNMWLVVYDGKYNYYLFNVAQKGVLTRYKQKRMPSNRWINTSCRKVTEYYSNFDNALNNLIKVVANNNKFLTRTKVL